MSQPITDTSRTFTVALGLWALAVAGGSLGGVFAILPEEEIALVASFGFVFALATAYLDEDVRSHVRGVRTGALATLAIEADLAIVLALMLSAGFSQGEVAPVLRELLAAMAVLFVAPLAAAVHVLLVERLLTPRAGAEVSPRAAKEPAVRRAAS